ncbi:hypothetical protein ACT3TP_07635 [Glutamicibacter sp. AOP38-B1-38]
MRHEVDENGAQVHNDIAPFMPTGTCAICAGVDQENMAPEDRET